MGVCALRFTHKTVLEKKKGKKKKGVDTERNIPAIAVGENKRSWAVTHSLCGRGRGREREHTMRKKRSEGGRDAKSKRDIDDGRDDVKEEKEEQKKKEKQKEEEKEKESTRKRKRSRKGQESFSRRVKWRISQKKMPALVRTHVDERTTGCVRGDVSRGMNASASESVSTRG
jgi:hypothetical protein